MVLGTILATSSSTALFTSCFSFIKNFYENQRKISKVNYPQIMEVTSLDTWQRYEVQKKYPFVLSQKCPSAYLYFMFPASLSTGYEFLINILLKDLARYIERAKGSFNGFTILVEIPYMGAQHSLDNLIMYKIEILACNKKTLVCAQELLEEYYKLGLTRYKHTINRHGYKEFLQIYMDYLKKYNIKNDHTAVYYNRFIKQLRDFASGSPRPHPVL